MSESQKLSQKAIQDVFGKGYVSVEGMDSIYDKLNKGEKLTENESKTLELYNSELGAHLTENLLGNESFIDRLVSKDTKLAEKVLNKIADLKKMFERIGDAEARAEYKQIKQAEKLYLGAVEKAGYAYVGRKIIASRREELDASEEIQYNRKKTPYVQWKSDALAWANSSRTKIGDMDSGSDSRYIYFYEAIDPDNDGRATDYRVVAKVSFANKKLIDEWEAEVEANNERNYAKRSNTIVYESADEYASTRKEYKGDNATFVEQPSRNGRGSEFHQGKSEGDGKRNTQKGDGSSQDVKYSLKESVEKDVLARCGTTYRWAETGYIFKDGTRLDLSGRRDGASGGRRTVDHRDIFDVYEDIDGGEAMIEFMSRGNIRVSPENPGINLQVEPTAEQYRLIQDMVERLGWKEEYFSVDFDDSNGDTVESLTYEGKVSARKVVADIKYYFKEGKIPYQSELSQFRYSLKADINDYTEKQYNDFGWARVNGVLSYRENGNFRAKYSEIKSGKQKQVHKTANGEIIVETNDMERGKFGVNNVLVFAKGGYNNYKITRVIRLKSDNETHLEVVRGFIYEYENDTNAQTRYTLEELYGEELIEQYDSRDFDDYRTSKKRARTLGGGGEGGGADQDYQRKQDGSGNLGENQGHVSFSLKDNPIDKYFYRLSDGQVKKALANYTKFKVYTRADAEGIINNVLGNYMSFGESYGVISGKTDGG